MIYKNVIPVLFCMVSLLAISACEKAEIQQSAKSNKHIEGRSCVDDCSDCAVNDCCCSITILDDPGQGVNIGLCGTSSPCLSTTACEAESVGNCADIDGFEEPFSFTSQFETKMFCVPQGSSFGITNTGMGTPRFSLTCQVGQFNPQTVTIQLNSPPAKPFWETNGSCELTSCF